VVQHAAAQHRDLVAVGEVRRRAELEQAPDHIGVAELECAEHRRRTRRVDGDEGVVDLAARVLRRFSERWLPAYAASENGLALKIGGAPSGGVTVAPRSSSRRIFSTSG